MKQIVLLILLFTASLSLSAQIKTGTFMLEGGINLLGDWNMDGSVPFTNGFGISFGNHDQYRKNTITGDDTFEWSHKSLNFSLAPRIGYFLFRNFVVGVDFRYRSNTITYGSDLSDRNKSTQYGFFARKYFGKSRITPFIESEIGKGGSKYTYYSQGSGGGYYQLIEQKDLFYFSGAAGACYTLSPKFKINLLGKIQHTREDAAVLYYGQSNKSKMIGFDSSLILSFSYFLNRKIKE